MPDESPLVRQWILLRTLCARRHGATVKELAQEMGVCEKTIRRDLETFHRAGFPLEETVGDYGRKQWRMDPARTQPGLRFTFDEAMALYLGRRFLEPLAGTLFWEAAQRAFRKIRATLGPGALKYIEQFGGMFHQTMVGTGDYSKKAEIIDQLMLGIEDSRAVFITYQSLNSSILESTNATVAVRSSARRTGVSSGVTKTVVSCSSVPSAARPDGSIDEPTGWTLVTNPAPLTAQFANAQGQQEFGECEMRSR